MPIQTPNRTTAAESTLLGLLNVLQSPDYQARLAEWVQVKTDALAALADAEQREAAVTQREKDLDAQADEQDARNAILLSENVKLTQRKIDSDQAEKVVRQQLDDGAAQLEAARNSFIDERTTTAADFDRQKAALALENTALHERANGLQDRENALAQREADVAAAEADLQVRLDRINAALQPQAA